jgi:hypothetical protein
VRPTGRKGGGGVAAAVTVGVLVAVGTLLVRSVPRVTSAVTQWQPPTQGPQEGRGSPDSETLNVHATRIPYPDSIEPAEVLANIKAVVGQTHLAEAMGIDELAMRHGELRIRRILQVRSEKPPPGFLVAELEGADGRPIANVATVRGLIIIAEDCRGRTMARSLDLSDAANRVRIRRGRVPLAAEYVYFDNVAERGVSETRPLVAVTTERGVIYLNSKGEAFAEERSPLVDESGGQQGTRALPAAPGVLPLRMLGQW